MKRWLAVRARAYGDVRALLKPPLKVVYLLDRMGEAGV